MSRVKLLLAVTFPAPAGVEKTEQIQARAQSDQNEQEPTTGQFSSRREVPLISYMQLNLQPGLRVTTPLRAKCYGAC